MVEPMHNKFGMKTLNQEFGFYAHHPEEMDEVYGVEGEDFEEIKSLFDFIHDDELRRMLNLANNIGRSASEQAKDLTSQVRSKIRDLIPKGRKNKIEDLRRSSDWDCGLYMQKAGFFSIEAWVEISTESNSLIARTFLWTREVIPDDMKNEIFHGITLPQVLTNDDPRNLIIGEINLRDAFDHNVSIDTIVDELTKPLSLLKEEGWSKLHQLAPQRIIKSLHSSNASRRSVR